VDEEWDYRKLAFENEKPSRQKTNAVAGQTSAVNAMCWCFPIRCTPILPVPGSQLQ
jgi:hypothetical protein